MAVNKIRSSVVKSEHVVKAEEASGATGEKVENLSKLHCVLATVDEEVTRDKAEDAIVD